MTLRRDHFNKENLHHAYLIEGVREEVVPEVLALVQEIGIKVSGNPDFSHISVDSFKVADARELKSQESEKAFSPNKKVFLISANTFLLEAQNTMLKMLEEPKENTHFFVITPDTNQLLATFVSRFYLIKRGSEGEAEAAEQFINAPLYKRINFLKELLAESEDEENTMESGRARAVKFLNSVEKALHDKFFSTDLSHDLNTDFFQQILKAREFLRQPGSSAKSLLEGVALCIPEKI